MEGKQIFTFINRQNNDDKQINQRQLCEVYSRVVGYIRPVAQWNPGKQSEYADRKEYEVEIYK